MTPRKPSNWPHGTDLGHSNFTLRFPRQASGGYRPGSETPPWGWPVTFFLGLAFCLACLFGGTLLLRLFS